MGLSSQFRISYYLSHENTPTIHVSINPLLMKRLILFTLAAALLAVAAFYGINHFDQTDSFSEIHTEEDGEEGSKEVRIREALEWNFEITKDPELGYPPTERLKTAIDQTRRLQQQYYGNTASRDGLEDARWQERGPSNIGGRTRTILFDAGDPTRKKIWVGGVSGGLWYTENIDENPVQWNKVNDYLDNLSVGALGQDPNDPDVMYMGTGEIYTGDIRGFGVFKSEDNGISWNLLPNASNANFGFTQSIVIHPETSDVYVGTGTGVWRSQDQGDTWVRVWSNSNGSNIVYDMEYEAGKFWMSGRNRMYSSETGDAGTWTTLGVGNGFPTGMSRIEFTICKQQPNIMYLVGNQGGVGSRIYSSSTSGESWVQRSEVVPGQDFTNGQVWYDLDIAVNPFNCGQITVGGVPEFHSNNAAFSFQLSNGNSQGTTNGHVDQHLIVYDDQQENRMFHGNDGGIYYRLQGNAGPIIDKNNGYNVTQFYACAFHPEEYSNYMLGGTQDNNSLQLNSPGIGTARNVNGGDGMFCHIDQNEGNIQIVSSQFGNYVISQNGGQSFDGGVSVNGSFVNISDYDDNANVLYAQTFDGDLYRYRLDGDNSNPIVNTGINGSITAIYTDPNVDDRVYIGAGGRLWRIDNANDGQNLNAVSLNQFTGTVISVDVENGNPDHILVTRSNYGIENNIFESTDGGETWVGVEGTAVANNLPDVPVRWGVFNPADGNQAMIATEVGVWATDNLDGENTVWYPPVPGRGTPLVRTDMLQVRFSDRAVLAATYGRGLWSTDVWSDPRARLTVPRVAYTDGRVLFDGNTSINAEEFAWNLGDGTDSDETTFYHVYDEIGTYDVSLKINNSNAEDLNDSGSIKVLPKLSLPYQESEDNYGGSFESNSEQYGIDNIGGNSTWERGSSPHPFKFGANTGDNAFSIAKDTEHYEENSASILYMPNFDFSDRTIYQLSFFARYELAGGRDGFNIEYSTNKGETWRVLGNAGGNWYNFPNESNANTPFPVGTPFFTGERPSWTEFKYNLTEQFGGQEDVAFRFVFRAGSSPGNYAGVAIDDFKITKFEGEPVTTIIDQSLEFNTDVNPNELIVKWSTRPEYYADKFEVFVSRDGNEFTKEETVAATGRVFVGTKNYTTVLDGRRDLYFVQIHAISTNEAVGLNDTLRAPIMVANKNEEDGVLILPNFSYFNGSVDLTFTGYINEPIIFELYDMSGRLINTETRMIDGFTTTYESPNLATGIYILAYKIGEQDYQTYKFMKAEN